MNLNAKSSYACQRAIVMLRKCTSYLSFYLVIASGRIFPIFASNFRQAEPNRITCVQSKYFDDPQDALLRLLSRSIKSLSSTELAVSTESSKARGDLEDYITHTLEMKLSDEDLIVRDQSLIDEIRNVLVALADGM